MVNLSKKIKQSIIKISITTSFLYSTPANAKTEIEYFKETPKITQTIINHDLEGRLAVFGVNLTTSCLKGGIGAKLRNEKFWKGCLESLPGGLITSLGEHIVSYNKIHGLGAVGKLTHDLGISMTDNIMRGENYFSQFQTDFGPLNFTFRGSYLPKIKFSITPIVGIATAISEGATFDPKNTLYNFTIIFDNERSINASTIGNIIQNSSRNYKDDEKYNKIALTHEMNHALGWRGLRFTENFGDLIPYTKTIGEYYDFGPDVVRSLMFLPRLNQDTQWDYLSPTELRAFAQQRY